ncbi:hypothetical protein WKI65_44060 [Streptomyces sp. MS1.AVA.3]|uniref:hypothetical protein n=1 Tax=Streptomyces decoyicus TaxID=249567 RepID=UPI0030C4A44D
MSGTATRVTARIGTTDWHLAGIRTGRTGEICDHCGRSLKSLYDVENQTAGQVMTVGRGCCKKVTGWTLSAAEAARILRAAEVAARQAEVWAEFTATHPAAAQMLEDDIRTWRPAHPGQANIPLHIKRDIARGATPRSWWEGRIREYRRTRRA